MTSTLLSSPLWAPSPSCVPLPVWGPYFCAALSHLYRAFHYHMRPFHPISSTPPRSGGSGVVCAGSGLHTRTVSALRSNSWLLSTYKFWQRFYQLCCSVRTLPRLCGFRAWLYQLWDAKHRVDIRRCVMQQTKRPIFVLGVWWQNKSTNGVVVTICNVVITQSTGLFFRQRASIPS